MLALLLDKSRKYLVLSGILAEQETQILDQLKSFGVNDTSVERDGEWMAVIIKR
jgi:ribosomal protein L11 methylase PrmA